MMMMRLIDQIQSCFWKPNSIQFNSQVQRPTHWNRPGEYFIGWGLLVGVDPAVPAVVSKAWSGRSCRYKRFYSGRVS